GGPIFVVGADRSGVSALACALAQHERIAPVADGAWVGELARALEDVYGAALASDGPGLGQQPPSPGDFAARFGPAAAGLVAEGATRWVDCSWQSTFAIERLAELFPAAIFIHVVRDVDTAVSVMVDPPLGSAGATGGTQVPARLRAKLPESDAIERWTSANRACLDAEATIGSERMLRVSFDALVESPEALLRACLEFAGEEYVPECLRPLRGLRARKAVPVRASEGKEAASSPLGAARELARSLLSSPAFAEAERARLRTHSRETASAVLSAHVPPDGVYAVVSRGDDELVRVGPGRGVHFPQDGQGTWAGHHPKDSAEAIAQLDAARRHGARFLYIPCTSLWWLDHYPELRRHLEDEHRTVVSSAQEGALFELAPPPAREAAPIVPAPAVPAASPAAAPTRGRVVLVTDHFPKYSETFFASEFAGLRERGWDVHVLCNRSNRDQWPFFPELQEELERKTRIHVVRDFEAQLAELEPDLVHFGYGTLARGRMHVRELLGCSVAVSFRGYDINYFGLDDPGCYDDVWAGADILHLVSEDIWKRAQRRGCPPDKPHLVVTDAVEVDRFTVPERRREEAGTRPLHIVGVGRLHWKKGYDYALSALRALLDSGVDARYRIVGEGPHREPMMFAIHELELEDHVELLGARTAGEVQETMRWADVCLHAAVSEGFCVSVIEAQAMGLPVVCTDADGLSENVEDGVTGFVVTKRDSRALAERLAELARDAGLRHRMGAAGRRRAEEQFDLSRQLDGLESLYRAALAAKREERPDGSGAANHEERRRRRRETVEALERELAGLERRSEALAKDVRGRRVAERVHEHVGRLLPTHAKVLVVTRGDEDLVDFAGREGWHFPQTKGGVYAGHHPGDSAAAIEQLESLRASGATHLVIPATSAWWLDHYADFRQHLEGRYVQVAADPDACTIYELSARAAETKAA
ncbi:MAG: glycosyltransferase, partial [Actinomycetota bacterium]|nr:glycosyltransferase [Actinomycetota bacterium]